MCARAGLPGDRPALLLVAVLLLMLGQWVVIAALLTVEALSTVAGVALLAVALQVCPVASHACLARVVRQCSRHICIAHANAALQLQQTMCMCTNAQANVKDGTGM